MTIKKKKMIKNLIAEIERLIDDAENIYREAIIELEAGKVRDSAEKVWCATVRATDALIVAATGRKPQTFRERREEFKRLTSEPYVRKKKLFERYMSRVSDLHIESFYEGNCEPIEDTSRRIRETLIYIEDLKPIIIKKSAELGGGNARKDHRHRG